MSQVSVEERAGSQTTGEMGEWCASPSEAGLEYLVTF